MEDKRFTFRQKWFPTITEAEDLLKERRENQGREYRSIQVPIRDFFGRWARSIFVGGALVSTTLWGGYNLAGNDFEYGKGTRTGMINKFSERGIIWKTSEGQMALEGIASGGNYVGANVWDFSLDNQARHGEKKEELAEKIQGYLESGTKVKVDYVQPFATWPWRSGTTYLVQDVEPINSKAEE